MFTSECRITHGPPYGILDATVHGANVGCESLLAHLPKLRPRLHVFGHIHEGHGVETRAWADDEQTIFVNAANWPAGKLVDGRGQKFGHGSFMPVIVDCVE